MVTLRNKKVIKIGGSFAIILDKGFFNNSLLNPNLKYDVELKEVEQNGDTGTICN
jgi:hypothetical protein